MQYLGDEIIINLSKFPSCSLLLICRNESAYEATAKKLIRVTSFTLVILFIVCDFLLL